VAHHVSTGRSVTYGAAASFLRAASKSRCSAGAARGGGRRFFFGGVAAAAGAGPGGDSGISGVAAGRSVRSDHCGSCGIGQVAGPGRGCVRASRAGKASLCRLEASSADLAWGGPSGSTLARQGRYARSGQAAQVAPGRGEGCQGSRAAVRVNPGVPGASWWQRGGRSTPRPNRRNVPSCRLRSVTGPTATAGSRPVQRQQPSSQTRLRPATRLHRFPWGRTVRALRAARHGHAAEAGSAGAAFTLGPAGPLELLPAGRARRPTDYAGLGRNLFHGFTFRNGFMCPLGPLAAPVLTADAAFDGPLPPGSERRPQNRPGGGCSH